MNVETSLANFRESMLSGRTKARYQAGIDKVTDSPMEKAASPEAEQKFLSKIEESVRSGRRSAALRGSSFARWKEQAKIRGGDRIASGATTAAALDKLRNHLNRVKPAYDAIEAEMKKPHDGSEESALARVAFVMREMKRAVGK